MDTAALNNPSGHKEADTAAAERRLRIYVCSPYRPRMESAELAKRELADNIDRAKTACRLVADMGAVPICSHLFCTQFLDDSIASEREQGRRIGLEMLKDADELWCFSEYISEGMMAEIQEASRLGLPVRMFCETTGLLLSGKLNDALSGRLFYADFGSHGGNSHFKNGCFCELFS